MTRHRLRRERFFQLAVVRHDRLHPAALARRQHHHLVALAEDAGRNRAGEAAEVEIGADDVLHRETQVGQVAVAGDVHRLQVVQQRRAGVPRHRVALGRDVVALQRRHRDEGDVAQVELGDEAGVVVLDALEDVARVADEVHLVDGDDDVPDAQERHDERVPAGLGHDAVAGVDEDDGQLARRGAGGHVARVLLVAGRVGDDELAAVGREVAIRDVDGDALLALGLQAVGQQGEVDLAGAGGADLLAVALHGGELVLVDHLGVVQQPADERALAVVDAAAGEEAQELLLLVAGEVGVDVFLTQVNGLHLRSTPRASSAPSTPSRRGRSPGPAARSSSPAASPR